MLDTHEQFVAAAYIAHQGALVRRLTAVTRDAVEAEDLAQDAYLRLAAEVEAGRVPEQPGAWLHRVGWNLAMSHGRHRSVVRRHSARVAQPDAPIEPDRTTVAREESEAIGVALGALSRVERHAVVLAAEGYTGAEVAAAIGRSHAATRTLLCRARAKLRGTLGAEFLTAA